MIVDELKNLKSYVALNPLFKDVVDFLESNNIEAFETGKHEIKGSDLFVDNHIIILRCCFIGGRELTDNTIRVNVNREGGDAQGHHHDDGHQESAESFQVFHLYSSILRLDPPVFRRRFTWFVPGHVSRFFS